MRSISLFLVTFLLIGATAPTPAEDAALGLKLAAYARRAGDADTMLAAARIIAASGLREAEIRDGALVAREPLPGQSTLAAGIAAEARLMAPGDATVAAAADKIASARPKGVIGGSWGTGPLQLKHMLPPGERIRWTVRTRGIEPVMVSAVGDGDADLHLRVADGRGKTVCDERTSFYYPLCRWSPARPAQYSIGLGNVGRVPTQVVILSN